MPSARSVFGKRIPIEIPNELVEVGALLAYLGLGSKELKRIWWYRSRMYHRFSIAKGSGKLRYIHAPDRRLKMLQRKLAPLLDRLYRVRNPVHGFVSARSVKTNALAHGQRRFVVNLDLKDFFSTITENRVVGLLRSLGIKDDVASVVARLCCNDGHLPQGAPTSPVLSNMICYRLDTDLLKIAKSARAIYTRYADDITFSTYQPPGPLFEGSLPTTGRFPPEMLAAALKGAFLVNGFAVHLGKAHYADRHARRIVTGVKINAGLNVDRRYVRGIRAILHSIEVGGLASAQGRYADKGGTGSIESHLRGKMSYLAHLKGQNDPVVRALVHRFNGSFAARPIKLTPTVEEMRDRSVWVIDGDEHTGTAFFLRGIGLVTAAHCVDGYDEVEVLHPSKHATRFKVRVLSRDLDRDLALLDHSGIGPAEYFELDPAANAADVHDAVGAFGYPDWAPGDRLNARPGHVSSLTVKFGVPKIEVTQQLTQGMSGGPILDARNEVVGIIHKGGPDEGRQLAVRLGVLLDWLKV